MSGWRPEGFTGRHLFASGQGNRYNLTGEEKKEGEGSPDRVSKTN